MLCLDSLVFITYMTQEGATKALRSLWNTKYDPKIPTVNPNYKVNGKYLEIYVLVQPMKLIQYIYVNIKAEIL